MAPFAAETDDSGPSSRGFLPVIPKIKGCKHLLRLDVSSITTPTNPSAPASRTIPDQPSPIVAREGWEIIASVVLLAGVIAWFGVWKFGALGWIAFVPGALLVCFCLWFFRNPQRQIPADIHALVAPADGVVIAVEPATLPEELASELGISTTEPMQRVVIFLNVFNVHVNRVPFAGTVLGVVRKAGGFAHAGRPEAQHNQRCTLAMKSGDGRLLAISQVTGLIARRIVCPAEAGQSYEKGQRFGLIRFGSRTDVYIPARALVVVKAGDKTMGGTTVIARW